LHLNCNIKCDTFFGNPNDVGFLNHEF